MMPLIPAMRPRNSIKDAAEAQIKAPPIVEAKGVNWVAVTAGC